LEFAGFSRQKISALRYTPTDGELGVVTINLPLDQFSPARQAHSLRLRASGLDETFALEKMAALMDVMDTCVSDLRKVWNVDVLNSPEGGQRKDSQGSLAGLFSASDFPGQAIANLTGGTVKIALLVDEAGKVADCSVVQTSGVAVLDAQSCIIVKLRANFTPAKGNDGKPAKQAFVQSITWRLQ
jgi:TonB family protein